MLAIVSTKLKIFKKIAPRILIATLLPVFVLFLTSCGREDVRNVSMVENKESFKLMPVRKPDGKPFHVAVIDLVPPIESSYLLMKGMTEELQKIGYIAADVDLSLAPENFDGYYKYLVSQKLGDYLVFDKNYYLVDDGKDDLIAEHLKREVQAGELDLIVATGTKPGQFLKKLDLGIPFLVSLATDPIASGIINSTEYSGNENIWALVEPESFSRAFEAYHSMLHFSKLGLVEVAEYEVIGGNGHYRKKAKEIGIELEEIMVTEEDTKRSDYATFLKHRLSEANLSELDAILFAYGTIQEEQAAEIAKFLSENKLPFLVGDGDNIVKNGGLIGLSYYDYEGYGHHVAKVMSNIFHGSKAGREPCIYTSPARIVLNLSTAKKSDFSTTMTLLRSANAIYR